MLDWRVRKAGFKRAVSRARENPTRGGHEVPREAALKGLIVHLSEMVAEHPDQAFGGFARDLFAFPVY